MKKAFHGIEMDFINRRKCVSEDVNIQSNKQNIVIDGALTKVALTNNFWYKNWQKRHEKQNYMNKDK